MDVISQPVKFGSLLNLEIPRLYGMMGILKPRVKIYCYNINIRIRIEISKTRNIYKYHAVRLLRSHKFHEFLLKQH